MTQINKQINKQITKMVNRTVSPVMLIAWSVL